MNPITTTGELAAAQHVSQAHVSLGERSRQTGLQLRITPVWLPQIDVVEGQIEGQEALKTGLALVAKTKTGAGFRRSAGSARNVRSRQAQRSSSTPVVMVQSLVG